MKKAIAIRLINSRSLFLGLLIFTLGIQQVSAQILGSRSRSSAGLVLWIRRLRIACPGATTWSQ